MIKMVGPSLLGCVKRGWVHKNKVSPGFQQSILITEGCVILASNVRPSFTLRRGTSLPGRASIQWRLLGCVNSPPLPTGRPNRDVEARYLRGDVSHSAGPVSTCYTQPLPSYLNGANGAIVAKGTIAVRAHERIHFQSIFSLPKRLQMVQFECPRHPNPFVSLRLGHFHFLLFSLPLSGVIRIGLPSIKV